MVAFATLDDVAAVGGVPVDVDAESAEAVRASRLIELASAQILSFFDGFDVTEAMILGDEEIEGWDEFRRDALAAITAEIAAKRMNVSAAASVDPYAVPMGGGSTQTLKLNRWEKRALRDLLPPDEDDEMPWVEP